MMQKPAKTSWFQRDHTGEIGGQIVLVPNPDRVKTINHAIGVFGHLIQRNEKLTPKQLIERIRRSYDCTQNQRNAEVVDALQYLI